MVDEKRATGRKLRKRIEREDRIIKAAEQLIFAKGFANTTIDDIALRADVSKGAVYLHYKTKDDIYFSIASRALEIMRDMFRKAVKEKKNGLEMFRAIGYSFYEYTKKYPGYSTMIYDVNSPRSSHSTANEQRCQSLYDEIGLIMVTTIEAGMRDGSIRSDVDPVAAALIISTSLQGLLRTILGEKEMMKVRSLDEKCLVDFAIELYGRSLMNHPGINSFTPSVRKGRAR